jgi:hypothetical protein
MKTFIKNYIWAIKNSYEYMEGLRTLSFWIKLPFKAYKIAKMNTYEEKHHE